MGPGPAFRPGGGPAHADRRQTSGARVETGWEEGGALEQ